MSKLPLNDPEINTLSSKEASPGVAKAVNVDPFSYAADYRVVAGKFTHVRAVEPLASVACKEEWLTIVGPGGYPRIQLPTSLPVNSNDPPLASLSFEYSNGALFRIDVRHSKSEDFAAAKLAAQSEKKDTAVALASEAVGECAKKPSEFLLCENLGGK